MTTSVIDVLTRARTLVSRGWTQSQAARSRDGKPVSSLSPEAVEYCALGALYRATGAEAIQRYHQARREVENEIPAVSLGDWNDDSNRTKAQVVEAFTRAIQRLESESS